MKSKPTPGLYVIVFLVSVTALTGLGGPGGCGSGGGETVSDTTAAANAVVSAAPLALSAALPQISGGLAGLTKASHIPPAEAGFTCSSPVTIGAATQRVTCSCPHGGNLSVDFTDPAVSGSCPRTISSSSTTTYNACVLDSCGRRTTLNGQTTGSVESRRSEVSSLRTAGACSGITATPSGGSTVAIGFDILFTDNGVSQTFSGSICVDGTSTAFTSRDEFEEALDPSGACAGGGGGGAVDDCTECLTDCVADGDTEANCRSGVCAFLCGELDCSAADNAKCRDAVAALSPAGLEASYRTATRCVERSLPGPCVIDCTRADPSNFDRCADIFDGLPDELTTFGCGCFGPPTLCDFTYRCAIASDCTADYSCSVTSGDPPPPPACY
jgi:hypothetical protein